MKQGMALHDSMSATKVEPKAHAKNVEGVAGIGLQKVYIKSNTMDAGRGYEAPKDDGMDIHPCGSQGKHS